MERHALGFAQTDALGRRAGAASLIEPLRDLYRAWALKRLRGNEDNIAGLCNFLSTSAGAPLRIAGLVWIAGALSGDPDGRRWYHDRTSAAFVDLLGTVLTENGAVAVGQAETKQALIDLVGFAVSMQLSTALALQDRLKALL